MTPSSSSMNVHERRKYHSADVANTMPEEKKPTPTKVSFSLPPHHSETKEEPDEVEQELDLFSKAIHISNIDEVSAFASRVSVVDG